MKKIRDNWQAWSLMFFGASIVIGSLFITTFLTENISKNFLLDVGYAIGGAIIVWGVSSLRQNITKKDKNNETIALVANHRAGNSEKGVDDNIFHQISGYSHDQVQKSGVKTTTTEVKVLLEGAHQNWLQTFNELSTLADFEAAWEVYFIMGANIRNALVKTEELDSNLNNLSGGKSSGEANRGRPISEISETRAATDFVIAVRALNAAISRRNESNKIMPSLQQLNSSNGYVSEETSSGTSEAELLKKENKRLSDLLKERYHISKFWYLFNIATTDMRQAYILIHKIDSGISQNTESDLRICRATLGACLERIRNCLRILEGPVPPKEQEGDNTTIHEEDLKQLVKQAKQIERGEAIQADNTDNTDNTQTTQGQHTGNPSVACKFRCHDSRLRYCLSGSR